MRILIYATSPIVNSGYGVAARQVAPLLRDLGHDIGFYAWNTGVGFMDYHGMPIYPRGNTLTGHDMLAAVVEHFRADVVLAICDPWIIFPSAAWHYGHAAKVVFWMPIQAAPVHLQMLDVAAVADRCLVYSEWGAQVLTDAGVQAYALPLGVGDAYKPLDRDECKAEFERIIAQPLDGRRVFGAVSANSSTVPTSRKAFDQLIRAFSIYQKEYGDGLLWIHTHMTADRGGINIPEIIGGTDLVVGCDVFAPETLAMNMGIHDEQMARLYNAFDVTIQATVAEGFGLPIIEAQACGTPVIVTDAHPMIDLLWHGASVPGSPVWINGAPGGWGHVPNSDKIADCMARSYGQSSSWRYVRDEFAWPGIALKLAKHLGEVVNG